MVGLMLCVCVCELKRWDSRVSAMYTIYAMHCVAIQFYWLAVSLLLNRSWQSSGWKFTRLNTASRRQTMMTTTIDNENTIHTYALWQRLRDYVFVESWMQANMEIKFSCGSSTMARDHTYSWSMARKMVIMCNVLVCVGSKCQTELANKPTTDKLIICFIIVRHHLRLPSLLLPFLSSHKCLCTKW